MPIVYGCFQTPQQSLLSSCSERHITHKPEVFTIWLFKEKFIDFRFKMLCFRIIVTQR